MRVLLTIPLLLILVVFALSNKQVIQLGLWPTDIRLDAPVSIAVLVIAGLFFVAGATMTWGRALAQGRRARRAESAVRQLEAQVQAMRARPATLLSPPGG